MEPPADALAAVTHPDPYPYYAELVARRPFQRDPSLGLWVAAGAGAVTAALTSEICRVRPAAEPVPRALVGTPAGELFSRLVRMNDGAYHLRQKPTVSATLAMLDAAVVAGHARDAAHALVRELDPVADPERLADFAFRISADTLARSRSRLVLDLKKLRWDEVDDLRPLRDKLAAYRSRVHFVLPKLSIPHPELILLAGMFRHYFG